jgi:pentatricopeptide repeat protein
MKFQTKKLIQSAEVATKSRNYTKANQLLGKAVAQEPENLDVKIRYATSLFAMSDFVKSADHFHRLHIDAPDDTNIWNGCIVSYLKLGNFEVATQFLKKMVSKNPEDYESWLNLCFAAGSAGQHADTLFYAMQALELKPLDTRSHNNLGCALLGMRRYKDALMSFQTALTIEPGNLDSLSNIATIYSLTGNTELALETYEQCLKFSDQGSEYHDTIKYRMSFDLLRIGDLKQGWQMYDYGFKPVDMRSRSPKRHFPVPLWDGRELKEERLLVWREQGLGDELLFFGALRDVQKHVKHLIIECDPRLVKSMQRSFPAATVRAQSVRNAPQLPPMFDDFDYQIPAGSLMALFRNSIEDFRSTEAYIKPDTERVIEFKKRLAALPHRYKIGICWRSGTLNAERNSSYTPISDWEPILRLPNVDIINLQYGDCREELDNVQAHFGITIHQWDDLNLKDDLDGVFSLAACLDHVVSVTTAPSVMAAAVGTPTSVLMPRSAWTLFGSDEYLIFPGMTPYICPEGQSLNELIPSLANGLLKSLEDSL